MSPACYPLRRVGRMLYLPCTLWRTTAIAHTTQSSPPDSSGPCVVPMCLSNKFLNRQAADRAQPRGVSPLAVAQRSPSPDTGFDSQDSCFSCVSVVATMRVQVVVVLVKNWQVLGVWRCTEQCWLWGGEGLARAGWAGGGWCERRGDAGARRLSPLVSSAEPGGGASSRRRSPIIITQRVFYYCRAVEPGLSLRHSMTPRDIS